MADRPDGTGGIQSLDQALRVLVALARRKRAASLSELARDCGMPTSKVHRYLASFLNAGFVRQAERSGKYDLGPASIETGLSALNRHDFVNRAADALPGLAADTGLTALLCVWGNFGPTVVRWERAASLVAASLGLGTALPLLTSATGRVFLAYLPEAVTAALRRKELAEAATSGREFDDIGPDEAGVHALAETVRAAGHAAVDGRYIPGLVAMAAPVLDWQGQAQAVVTLIGTDPRAIAKDAPALGQMKVFCAALSITGPGGAPA
ncbi:IclR family transcriptional regulator [Nitratireductor alexandrii]|uniref:IclR family transcriptional regulator n=1 Tax=Nitratireductor alexandrii TaxID=2448161 RepID=UPI000FD7225D|nr:IclR family transcriptional regulator [Nitratireductor alexandrii]